MSVTPKQFLLRHGLTVLIGALAIGLVAVIGAQTQWGAAIRPATVLTVAKAPAAGDTSLLPAFVLPGVDAGFKESLDRPLFLPTRRPVPVTTAPAQPLMKKGQFRLAGTVVNQEQPFAFLVEIATGKGVRVAKGAEIPSTGISLATVDAMRIVLKQGDETEELSLRTASSPPAPAAAPAAQPGTGQRPPPPGVLVGGMPSMPGVMPVPLDASAQARTLQPGMSALPGFVQSTPAPNAAPANPNETAVGNQRRRRFPGAPQQ
jgi:hypothetical protein